MASGTHKLGSRGGEENHTLTVAEMPSHTHGVSYALFSNGGSYITQVNLATQGWYTGGVNRSYPIQSDSSGSSNPHNNMPPYITVNVWYRTA